MKLEMLKQYGIDYEKGLERCMDDEEFYKEYIAMFLEDDCYPRAVEAFAKEDYDTMFKSLHELKGVCGNAELFELYEQVCPLVELLRKQADSTAIKEQLDQVTIAYDRVKEGITQII